MMPSATRLSGARITPIPCVPSEQLDHHRCAADAVDGRQHVLTVAHERRARHADVVAGQDLDRPQLVARVGDAVRGVRRVDVHLLELADDGGAEVGDRRADPRDDRVVVGQRLAAELEVGLGAGEVDRETQRVRAPCRCGRDRSRPASDAACCTTAARATGLRASFFLVHSVVGRLVPSAGLRLGRCRSGRRRSRRDGPRRRPG